ncbi:unnamed protein product [Brugia timori]|uniref:Uncharacterized protein n=1 Tax=Brugia timori TaxID=42155 RepID=A0A3P7VWL5_9BILA|nr:unnamed protein product [Brugia timori]
MLSYKKSYTLMDSTRESIINYGKNFARLLRERWLMGECDEDILFFILLKRPNQLMRRSTLSYLASGTAQQTPYIFASYGSLVREKIDPFHSLPNNDLSMNQQQRQHYFDPLQEIIEAENINFENGYSLKVVTENLLDRFEATLSQEYTLPRARSHIPDWAMIVFIICALLCLLMTVG